ncbi:probable methyltransferase-like protein 25 [Lineus longissimus]|uniref:probable methyltransferase-like protein 25 n=1 Tax=Lineus longissimus TaxID=88925 RepID=UPI002B4EACC0
MFLPPFYVDSPDAYLKDATKCLQENYWIFNFQITNFFGNSTWEKIPVEWREPLLDLSTQELNELPYHYCKEDWPESLKSFLQLSQRLSLPRQQSGKNPTVKINKDIKRGMIPKKIAEVSSLAAVVDAVCREGRCEGVIDVGAGLGYLGQVLTSQYGRDVISLELKDDNTEGAKQRQVKQGSNPKSRLYTVELKDDTESRENLKEILRMESRNLAKTRSEKTSCRHCPDSCESEVTVSSCVTHGCETTSPTVGGDKTIYKCASGDSLKTENSADSGLNCNLCISEKNNEPSDSGVMSGCVTHGCEILSHTVGEDKTRSECARSESENGANGGLCCNLCNTEIAKGPCDDLDTRQLSQNVSRRIDVGFCMVGLHCCGDLTPTMLKMFGDIEELTHLVCVSCCYHNMEKEGDDGFRNFPMSCQVRDAVCGGVDRWCSHFAFRLAAQETRARWKHQSKDEHEQHTRHVAYRGILQEFMGNGDNKLKKIKRKVARKSAFVDFGSYLDAVLERTEGVDVCSQRQELLDLYITYEDRFEYIEPITALQVILQPVIESLITIDRVIYLNERGIPAEIVPLFDEFVSPRNLAIIAKKS